MAKVLLSLLLLLPALEDGVITSSLTVRFDQLPVAGGPVIAALFSNAADFDRRENPVSSISMTDPWQDNVWHIDQLPYGDYGVLAFQDLNANGELDFDSRRRPREPFSTSGRVLRGAPKFRAAAVKVASPIVDIVLDQWRYRESRSSGKEESSER